MTEAVVTIGSLTLTLLSFSLSPSLVYSYTLSVRRHNRFFDDRSTVVCLCFHDYLFFFCIPSFVRLRSLLSILTLVLRMNAIKVRSPKKEKQFRLAAGSW